MNNINTEAKNEVRELLGELVVSPVTSDVKSIISSIETSLSQLSEEQKNKILGLSTLITSVKKKMSEEITNKFDELSGNLGGLEQNSKSIKTKTEELNKKLSEIEENYQKICEIINDIEYLKELLNKVGDNLSNEIPMHFERFSQNIAEEKTTLDNLNKKIDDSTQHVIYIENLCHSIPSDISKTIKTCHSETIDIINNSGNSINAEIKSISSEIQEFNSNIVLVKSELATINNLIISSFDQVGKNQHAFEEQLNNKMEDVNNKLSVLTKTIDCGNESLKEQNNVNWESFMHIIKQNTKMFYVMLALSIINSFGLFSILYMLINS